MLKFSICWEKNFNITLNLNIQGKLKWSFLKKQTFQRGIYNAFFHKTILNYHTSSSLEMPKVVLKSFK